MPFCYFRRKNVILQQNNPMATDSFSSKARGFFSKHPIIANLLAICLAGLVLLWLIMLFLNVWTHHGDDATVPEIKQLSYLDAKDKLRKADLEIEISDSIYDTSIAPGTVVESWPKAGSQVKRGRKVYVTLTAFSPKHVTLSMPITGVSVRQATSYLNALGVNGIRVIHVPSEYPDLVEGAHYNGRPLGVGSVIPVDATVVLEVGIYQAPAYDELDEFSDELFDDADDSAYDGLPSGSSSSVDDNL